MKWTDKLRKIADCDVILKRLTIKGSLAPVVIWYFSAE